ncbi:hypothetical protein SDC9_146488 [bioreactor metagenome]|uniref:Uncharacterized protein n=1 Tax=bioreactor metagenome TaxID=1076179 RepID=A0A645EBD8_9ZZZZ
MAGVNDREHRAEDARIDMHGQQCLHRNVLCDPCVDCGDALDDWISERDEHKHGARDPEHRADSAPRKARRAVDEEAEPAYQQDAEYTGEDDTFTFFHNYASTVTSPLGFA